MGDSRIDLLDIITRLIAYHSHLITLAYDPTSKNLRYKMKCEKDNISFLVKEFLDMNKPKRD